MTTDEFVLSMYNEGLIAADPYQGIIYSKFRYGDWAEPRPISGSRTPNGYVMITLRHNKVRKNVLAHRAMWLIIYGVIPQGMEVQHINNKRWDNRIDNLRLVVPKERVPRGENHPLAKLDWSKVRRVRKVRAKHQITKLFAAQYMVHKSTIYAAQRYKTWYPEENA